MRLADFITDRMDDILNEWEAYARRIPAASEMDGRELRDHARQMLETMARDLGTPQSDREREDKSKGQGPQQGHGRHEESGAEKHAAARTRAGFGIEDLVSEFRALRASVLRLWNQASREVAKTDFDDMYRFNEAIDQAVAESVARHAAMVRQAQDMFLGILGHDLRNPLGAISMSSQFLVQSPALESRYVKAAAIIHNSAGQMERLIRDLLDFTRTRLGQGMPISPEPADLRAIAQQAVAQACAFHPEHVLRFDAHGDLHGVWDTERIGQVFSNLLGNAFKHGRRDAPIQVVLTAGKDDVTACVRNQGTPISPQAIARIFEPLCRSPDAPDTPAKRAEDGLGLGLYIVREIVHAHGGEVSVSSCARAGTTFTVTLPRTPAPH